MSVDMFIIHSDGTEQHTSVCGQTTGVKFIGELARTHGFRILTGTYPVWAEEGDLEQLLHELTVIRGASGAELIAASRDPEDVALLDRRWAHVIDMLKPLAKERGWQVTFG
jgi:hypothetical protein